MGDEREFLDFEDAVKWLPEGEYIHTLRQSNWGGPLIRADWSREELLAEMRANAVEKSGPTATAAGHGLCIVATETRLFIEATEPGTQPQSTN